LLRNKIAQGASIVCTATAIRVSGLYNRSEHLFGPLSKRKISPYFALALKMDGLEKKWGGVTTGRCKALRNVGTDFAYPANVHKVVIGFPKSSDVDLINRAALIIQVKDQPELEVMMSTFNKLGMCARSSDNHLGTAALGLSQLVTMLEFSDHVECEVNLELKRGPGYTIPAGMMRLQVKLDVKVPKPPKTSEPFP